MATLLFCVLAQPLWSQNLVPNPSFESYGAYPTSISQANNLNNWFVPPSHNGSSDFFHSCSSSSLADVPGNLFGSQLARTGNGYIGGYIGYRLAPNENYREYLEVQLSSPLVAGQTYLVEAYLSMPDNVGWYADHYGFYLSNTQLNGTGNHFHLPVIPQVEAAGSFFTNTTGWTQIGGTYVASGGEQFLTIGNFRDFTVTNIAPSTGGSVGNPYIYVDDVSISPIIVLAVDYEYVEVEFVGGMNELRWETANEDQITEFRIERSEDGINYGQIGAVDAGESYYQFTTPGDDNQPTQYYRLKAIDEAGLMYMSEVVVLKGNDFRTQASLYPSSIPAGGTVRLDITGQAGDQIQIALYDMTGKVLYEEGGVLARDLESKLLTPPVGEAGAYLMRVIVADEVRNFRFVVR